MRPLLLHVVPALFALLAPPASALGLAIPFPGAGIAVSAQYEETTDAYRLALPPVAVPESGSLQAVAQGVYGGLGEAQSSLTYSLTTSAFSFDFSSFLATSYPFGGCYDPFDPFCAPQEAGPSSTSAAATISFIPDANVGYALSGFFDGSFSEMPAGMSFFVSLCDHDVQGNLCNLAPYLFLSNQSSGSTPNESFTLGAHGGDGTDELSGSLTGTLIANHTYTISFSASFDDQYAQFSLPSATGNVTLTFVPEPGTELLLVTGLAGVAARRRRT